MTAGDRRPRSERRRRIQSVIFRLTEAEHAQCRRRAAAEGFETVNAYARARLLGDFVLDRRSLAQAAGALGRIGGNLNQLAAWANRQRRPADAAALETVQRELMELLQEIREKLR